MQSAGAAQALLQSSSNKLNYKVHFSLFSKEYNNNRTRGRKNSDDKKMLNKKNQAAKQAPCTFISHAAFPFKPLKKKCSLDRWCFPCLDSSSNLLFGETKFSTELHIIHQQRINRLNIACSQIAAVLWCSISRSPLRTGSMPAAHPAPG